MGIPITHIVFFALLLFIVGLFGVLFRRNLLMVLLSVEIMINASAFLFVAASNYTNSIDGQIMFIFILTVAASEVAITLGILLKYHEHFSSLDINAANNLKG